MSGVQQLVRSRRIPLRATPGLAWGAVDLPERGTTWALDHSGPGVDAPTVVLLHGLAATGSLNWDALVEPLAERFRVLALDHRGHGRGIEPQEAFTLEDCADDVVALLDACGVRRAVLVGYSMGGAIAQLSAHRHPHRVAGLVLVATAARFELPPGSELITRVLAELDRYTGGLPVFGSSTHDLPDAVQSLATFDSRPWLGQHPTPARVLLTVQDRVVVPDRQRELAAIVAEGRTIDLELGHLSVLFDQETMAEAVGVACEEVAIEGGLYLRWWESIPWRARRLRGRVQVWRRHRRSTPKAPTPS